MVYHHAIGGIYGAEGFDQRDGIRIEAVARAYRWNKIPNRGGRTLVNGTGYDVKIANSGYIVTLVDGTTGAMSADYAYATINGVRYISPATVEIHKGDTIQIFVRAPQYNAFVFLNGTIIKKGTDGEPAVYSYEPESNCNLEFRFDSAWGYMSCYITT